MQCTVFNVKYECTGEDAGVFAFADAVRSVHCVVCRVQCAASQRWRSSSWNRISQIKILSLKINSSNVFYYNGLRQFFLKPDMRDILQRGFDPPLSLNNPDHHSTWHLVATWPHLGVGKSNPINHSGSNNFCQGCKIFCLIYIYKCEKLKVHGKYHLHTL